MKGDGEDGQLNPFELATLRLQTGTVLCCIVLCCMGGSGVGCGAVCGVGWCGAVCDVGRCVGCSLEYVGCGVG